MNNILYIDQSPTGTAYAVGSTNDYGEINLVERKEYQFLDSTTTRVNTPNGEIKQKPLMQNFPPNTELYFETLPDSSTRETYWRFDASQKIYIKQKRKTIKHIYTDEQRVRILFVRLDAIIKKFNINEIVYETTGSIPKRFDPKTKTMVPLVNVKTLLKLGQIESAIMLLAHTNGLKATRTIRAQDHQLFVRNMLMKLGVELNIEEKFDKKTKKYKVKHLTKLDSKKFASMILKEEIKSDNIADAISMKFYDKTIKIKTT